MKTPRGRGPLPHVHRSHHRVAANARAQTQPRRTPQPGWHLTRWSLATSRPASIEPENTARDWWPANPISARTALGIVPTCVDGLTRRDVRGDQQAFGQVKGQLRFVVDLKGRYSNPGLEVRGEGVATNHDGRPSRGVSGPEGSRKTPHVGQSRQVNPRRRVGYQPHRRQEADGADLVGRTGSHAACTAGCGTGHVDPGCSVDSPAWSASPGIRTRAEDPTRRGMASSPAPAARMLQAWRTFGVQRGRT
jgi:hypothetical protein